MIHPRSIYFFLIAYFALLSGLAPINLLSFDTYYYWDWSRHLALSYYDGSPMIAYFIKLSRLLFGDTLFALSSVGIISAAFTSFIIYKTARLFLTQESSCIAMLSWLLSPLVTMDILTQTTYDTPLTLFWALTLYYGVKYLHTHDLKDLYFIGTSAGLMMLSKYTGIVLLISLFLFLISSSYRSLFKTRHFYFSLFLALIIFSPVLIWNYQNQWLSFSYQLTTHQLASTVNPVYNIVLTFFKMFLPALNFMLIPPFLVLGLKFGIVPLRTAACPQYPEVSSEELQTTGFLKQVVTLCFIICVTFLIFYLYTASKAEIRIYWLAPYLISSALLFGYCFEKINCRRLSLLLITLYGIISLGIFIDNTYKYSFVPSKKLISYRLIEQFNSAYPQLPKIILTSGWFEARNFFFLKNKPAIYTLGLDHPQNQYALWSKELQKKIADKSLKEALYIDSYERQSYLDQYFDQCKKIPTNKYFYRNKEYALYVYKCINY